MPKIKASVHIFVNNKTKEVRMIRQNTLPGGSF